MDLPPLSDYHEPMESRASTASASSSYPISYFLCDKLVDAKVLKADLDLTRTPKLRKARIVGYLHSACKSESTVMYDGTNFGEWSTEEIIKGVILEVLSECEERALAEHIGGDCGIKEVELEVACASLLGKVGKMEKVMGRIFVPQGEGDKLPGRARQGADESEKRVKGNADFFDLVVPPGGLPTAAMRVEDDERYESDGSSTFADGHLTDGQLTPPIGLVILTEAESETPHEPLEPLPGRSLRAELQAQNADLEGEPQSQNDETEAKSMTSTEEFLYLEAMRDRDDMLGVVIQETKGAPEEHAVEMNIDKVLEECSKEKDNLPAEEREKLGMKRSSYHAAIREINKEATKLLVPNSQPWSPTRTWKKENAIAPVRPALHPDISHTDNDNSGRVRSRHTSESIRSLVQKFEDLSPKTTPNSTPKKRGV